MIEPKGRTDRRIARFDNRFFASAFIMTIGLFGIIELLGVGVMSPSALAEGSSASASVNVTPVCSMTTTGGNSYSATITGGSSSEISGSSIKTLCSDGGGYAIYATGFTGDTIGGENSTKLVGSSVNIATGTGTSGDNSTWAMKLATDGDNHLATLDNGYNSYNLIPSAYTKVAHYDAANINPSSTSQDAEGNGSILNVSYQVYISPTQRTDSYTGKVKYTLVHPSSEEPPHAVSCAAGKICYNANTNIKEGTMANQSASNNAEVVLYPSNFSRTGYGFAGWSDKYDYETNPDANFYGPMESITTPSDLSTKGLSLYAVWIKSEGSIQDTAKVSEVCTRLAQSGPSITKTLNSVSALTDQRDGNTYAIAKLADGKCWMIENLRLDNTAEHNSDGTLAQGYGTSATYGNFGGLADPESTGFTSTYSANSLYSNDGSNNTINIGTSNYPRCRMPRYNNLNTSARGTNTTTDQNIYSYGNYYTWHAAIADLTYNGTNNSSVTNTSLCPTGWHLPTGGLAYASGNTSGVNVTGDSSTFREFYNLGYTIMGSNKTAYEDTLSSGSAYYSSNTTNPDGKTATAAFRSFPNNFLYSGLFRTSSADYRGSGGLYWSSTAYGNDSSYYLYLDSSSVYPGTTFSSKYGGQSIRCVAGS